MNGSNGYTLKLDKAPFGTCVACGKALTYLDFSNNRCACYSCAAEKAEKLAAELKKKWFEKKYDSEIKEYS